MAKADILNRAIQDGDEDLVRSLVRDGADVDHLFGMRGTALCAAITAKQVAIANFLIDVGCDVNGEDFDREPPLYLAVRKECLDIAWKLIKHPKCKLDKPDPLTKTPTICYAARKGIVKVVEWLVDRRCRTEAKDGDGNTALHLAVENGNHRVIPILIKSKMCVGLYNDAGLAPVHIASRRGDIKAMLQLLNSWLVTDHYEDKNVLIIPTSVIDEVRAFVNYPSKIRKELPLMFAVYECKIDMVKLLLRCGADPNVSSSVPNCLSPLMKAVVGKTNNAEYLTVVELLLKAGAHTDASLTYAATMNDIELTKMILKCGANVNASETGETPLYVALSHGSFEVAWYIMKECYNVDFLTLDDKKRNLLHALADTTQEGGIVEIVDFLLEKGCDVNGHEDQLDGLTPLHQAVNKQNKALVQCLLLRGANPNASASGVTPFHVASEFGDLDIGYLLLKSGADINRKTDDGMTSLDLCLEYEDESHEAFTKFLIACDCRVPFRLADFGDSEDDYYQESSDSDSDSSDSIRQKSEVHRLINHLATSVHSLKSLSVDAIRRHFIENEISFAKISSLPLPDSLIAVLTYRCLPAEMLV